MLAAQYGFENMTRWLLEHHADVNLQNSDGATALIIAAMEGEPRIVSMLLQARADVNLHDDEERTAVLLASTNDHADIVDVLAQHGADVNIPDDLAWTPLMHASCRGHYGPVHSLIAAGADMSKVDNNQNTALIHAAKHGHSSVVECLLSSGAAADAHDINGLTSIIHAAFYGHLYTVKALVNGGANVNARDASSGTALMSAALAFKSSVRYGKDILKACGLLEIVSFLLEHGADADVRDDAGNTALVYAVEAVNIDPVIRRRHGNKIDVNQRAIVEALVDSGACVNPAGAANPPLLMAVESALPLCTTQLLEYGADPLAKDETDRNAILTAVAGSDCKCLKILLQRGHGQLQYVVLEEGEEVAVNCLDVAVSRGNYVAAHMLLIAGGKPSQNARLGEDMVDSEEERNLQEALKQRSMPMTLKELCRHKVRRMLPVVDESQLARLPLPPILQNYIILPELDVLLSERTA